MAVREELINGLSFVTPRDRLGFYVKGINPARLEQIKEAIRNHFPQWQEDEWWWAYYKHERVVLGQIDGRSFEEETGHIQMTEDDMDENGDPIEVPWMDRVALSVWRANEDFCEFSYDVASIPHDDGHWTEEDFTRLTGQSPNDTNI
jgi:hypothetical protein